MTQPNQGTVAARDLLGHFQSSLADFAVSSEDPEKDKDAWSQTLKLRQGWWVGADVKITERRGEGVQVEVETASKGSGLVLVISVLVAVGAAFAYYKLGMEGGRGRLLPALLSLPALAVTIPLGMMTSKILGKSHVAANERLLQQVREAMAAKQL